MVLQKYAMESTMMEIEELMIKSSVRYAATEHMLEVENPVLLTIMADELKTAAACQL